MPNPTEARHKQGADKRDPESKQLDILLKYVAENQQSLTLPANTTLAKSSASMSTEEIWRTLQPPQVKFEAKMPVTFSRVDTRKCHSSGLEPKGFKLSLLGFDEDAKFQRDAKDILFNQPEVTIDFEKDDFSRLSDDIRGEAGRKGAVKVRLQKLGDDLRVQYLSGEGKVLGQLAYAQSMVKQLVIPTEKESLQMACKEYQDALQAARSYARGTVTLSGEGFNSLGDTLAAGLQKIGAKSVTSSGSGSHQRVSVSLPGETNFSDPSLPFEKIVISPTISCSISSNKDQITISNIKGVKIDMGYLVTPWVYPSKLTLAADGKATVEFTLLGVNSSKTLDLGGGAHGTFEGCLAQFERIRDARSSVAESKVALKFLEDNPKLAQEMLKRGDKHAQRLLTPEKFAVESEKLVLPTANSNRPRVDDRGFLGSTFGNAIKIAEASKRTQK